MFCFSICFVNIKLYTNHYTLISLIYVSKTGVELHDDVIEHCKTSIAKWKNITIESRADEVSIVHFIDSAIADIQIIKGNGLNILKTKGEGIVGFDRIYIGAAVDKEDLESITKLLSPGGILVGPGMLYNNQNNILQCIHLFFNVVSSLSLAYIVDDELVKVVRVGNISLELEGDDNIRAEDEDSSLSGLNGEFTSQILSGVRFAPLVMNKGSTIIPANVWNPTIQRGYPREFKKASMQLLMCSNSQVVQPLPRLPSQDERTNVAAMLPKSLWLEILSYTHRKWFEPELNETDYLKRRLREEKAKAAKAEKARREAEERCLAAERERVSNP